MRLHLKEKQNEASIFPDGEKLWLAFPRKAVSLANKGCCNMFACSERPGWVTVKDSIAEGKAVPGPARRRLPASPRGRAAVCPQGGHGLQGGAAELALIKNGLVCLGE